MSHDLASAVDDLGHSMDELRVSRPPPRQLPVVTIPDNISSGENSPHQRMCVIMMTVMNIV